MLTGLNKKTETNIKLPFAFILYSLVAFVISQWILFQHADAFAHGSYRMPDLWMAVHFLLLGWAVMAVMGAMYQLIPVAFLTPIWNEKFGFFQFGITAFGITAFALLLGFKPTQAIHAAGLVVVGILMFLFQMFMTLKKQEQKNTMTMFVGTALISFFLTIMLGLTLAWNFAFGQIIDHQRLFDSHLLFGITGWFSLLIFGFSYKMVPMFSLSHGFSMKWAKKAYLIYIAGMLILLLTFWTNLDALQVLGWFLLALGFSLYGLDMREILKKRIKKRLDRPFVYSLIAIGFGWTIHLLAFLTSLIGIENTAWWGLLIYLYLMLWIISSILGYLYKIVPFLWWTHKYSKQVGKENVPMLKDMINEKLGTVVFACFAFGTIGVTFASFLQLSILVQGFQAIMLLTAIVYSLTIIRVLLK